MRLTVRLTVIGRIASSTRLVHKKKFSINLSKVNTKFCSSLHCNADNSYLFIIGKETKFKFEANLRLKLTIKMLTFQYNFVCEVFLMDLVLLSLEKYL